MWRETSVVVLRARPRSHEGAPPDVAWTAIARVEEADTLFPPPFRPRWTVWLRKECLASRMAAEPPSPALFFLHPPDARQQDRARRGAGPGGWRDGGTRRGTAQ